MTSQKVFAMTSRYRGRYGRRLASVLGWLLVLAGSDAQSGFAIAASSTPLPPNVEQALAQGKMAASQKDWAVAIVYFDEARRAAPLQPQPLYYLGLAETQLPGRELRAVAWLEAFLALDPQNAAAANVRHVIGEMEIRARSNLNRVRHLAQQLADKMDFKPYRADAEETVNRLSRRADDLPSTLPQESHEGGWAKWSARAWIALVERCMKGATFVDFDRALSRASDGRALVGHRQLGHYEPDSYPVLGLRALVTPTATPAQERLSDIFESVSDLAEDILLGLRDVLEFRNIVGKGVVLQGNGWPNPVNDWKVHALVCHIPIWSYL
jgi:hypothetical protein